MPWIHVDKERLVEAPVPDMMYGDQYYTYASWQPPTRPWSSSAPRAYSAATTPPNHRHHVHVVDHEHPTYHTHHVIHRHHYPHYVAPPTHHTHSRRYYGQLAGSFVDPVLKQEREGLRDWDAWRPWPEHPPKSTESWTYHPYYGGAHRRYCSRSGARPPSSSAKSVSYTHRPWW